MEDQFRRYHEEEEVEEEEEEELEDHVRSFHPG